MGLVLGIIAILLCQWLGNPLTDIQSLGILLIGQLIDIEVTIKSLKK